MATAKEMRAQTSTRAQLYAPVIKLYAVSYTHLTLPTKLEV